MALQREENPVRIVNPQGMMPRGIDDFAKMVTQQRCFVDKSCLARDVLTCDDDIILITRPRRFGKTINMSMLRTFFDTPQKGADTKALFDGLLVADDRATIKHQGKYPVISLTLKSAKLPTWEKAYDELCSLICQEIDRHPQASDFAIDGFGSEDRRIWNRILSRTEATQADWHHSLELLCKVLALHHNKDNPNPFAWTHPIVLIDEYDAPIHSAYTNSLKRNEDLKDDNSYYNRMIEFIRPLLSNALKGNRYLHKAVLTGILRVSKEDIFSGLNNPGVYGVLNYRFASSFGFTENEVDELLRRRGLSDRLEEVRTWYDGYRFGKETIYNPWSVVSYLANPEEGARLYWVNTSDNALVHTLLRQADAAVKDELLQLLFAPIDHLERPIVEEPPLRALTGTADELWGLLLASGYATAEKSGYDDPVSPNENVAHLRLPNREVTTLYKHLLRQWFAQEPGMY